MRGWLPVALCSLVALGGSGILAFRGPQVRVLSSYATPLTGRMRSQKHNAALGIEHLNGVVIGPHEVFSFNRTVGSWSRDQGYKKAPVSYNGQLISSWGGGVCQTSTTLYNAALLSGMCIIERHPHRFAPSYVPPGRDAAVAFSSVDLRFVNPYDFPVEIRGVVANDKLCISIVGSGEAQQVSLKQEIREVRQPQEFVIRGGNQAARVRNSGKPGYEVLTWRLMNNEKQLVSSDSYPAMQRIVEYR